MRRKVIINGRRQTVPFELGNENKFDDSDIEVSNSNRSLALHMATTG